MHRLIAFIVVLGLVAPLRGQGEQPATVASRIAPDGSRSMLAEVRASVGALDEIRIELPKGVAQSAVLLRGPAEWKAATDGNWLRLAGPEATPPFRLRVALFDARDLGRARLQLRLRGRNVSEQRLTPTLLPPVAVAGSTAGLVHIPSVVAPGESIDVEVLNPARTPPDGEWIIGGVAAAPNGEGRLRVTLPDDLLAGTPLRVSYFDPWGERLLDAPAVDDVAITEREPAGARPRITGCSRYGLLGESICVCGDFPDDSWRAITIDGQPASVVAASRHVAHVRLRAPLAPGPHVIAGDPAAGFAAGETATTRALALRASIDASALLRGQSTTMRVAIDGADEPITLAVINRTPGVIAIPGGHYQEIEIAPNSTAPVERTVNARSVGNFLIDTKVLDAPCPCLEAARAERPSPASQQDPVFVPRRVLATIAAGTPQAMLTTAQAVATANGLAVVEVAPLPLTGNAMAVFEIVDGIGAIAKAAALAADPNVVAAQPDFIYDTFQGGGGGGLAYGPDMIGADLARSVSMGTGVRVAVIDTGIDIGHLRLENRLAEYTDVTGTGWTPDVHGTLVAGVIAAEARDGAAPGVAPGATIVGVKACVAQSATRAAARCWSSTLARAIDAASRLNVRVMNLSVGGKEDPLLTRMVNAAAARGITMVSAAGNDGPSGRPSYPAAIDNVLAVTAVDAAGRLYPRATRGSFIDVAAPGVDVISTGPGSREQLFSGTSAATAFAAGAVALLLQDSTLSADQLRALLTNTAKDLGPEGRDDEYGSGLLDVCRAVTQASGRQIPCR